MRSASKASFLGPLLFAAIFFQAGHAAQIIISLEEQTPTRAVPTVTYKFGEFASSTQAVLNNKKYIIDVGEDQFGDEAYLVVYLTISWKPEQTGSVELKNVANFETTFPVLLRAWRLSDTYNIGEHYMKGYWNKHRDEYEKASTTNEFWAAYFGSLQQEHHFRRRLVNASHSQTKRTLNSAVFALHALATGTERSWFTSPKALRTEIDTVFANDKKTRQRLNRELDDVDGLIWKDLLGIENNISSLSCPKVKSLFAYLKRQAEEHPKPYARQIVGDSRLLEEKENLATEKVCK